MFTAKFWRATAERAVRTAAQTAVATLGADGLGIVDVDWGATASVTGMAALLAVLTAVATAGGKTDGPGLTETVKPGA